MKIILTIDELKKHGVLSDALELIGLPAGSNYFGEDTEEVTLTPEQAVNLGLIEEGYNW